MKLTIASTTTVTSNLSQKLSKRQRKHIRYGQPLTYDYIYSSSWIYIDYVAVIMGQRDGKTIRVYNPKYGIKVCEV